MNVFWQLMLISLPTTLKLAFDLEEIKKLKQPVKHASELKLYVLIGIVLSLINALGMTNGYSFWIRFIQSLTMSFGIFVLFFDWLMGLALHGNPLYLGEGEQAAKTDQWFTAIGPLGTTLIRLWIAGVAIGTYFYMNLII